MIPGSIKREVISATNPRRYQNTDRVILLKVWFEEMPKPVEFVATPFDCEQHGRALWARARAGEYGPITIIPEDLPRRQA